MPLGRPARERAGQPVAKVAVVSQRPQTDNPGMIAEPHFPRLVNFSELAEGQTGTVRPRFDRATGCEPQTYHRRLSSDPNFQTGAKSAAGIIDNREARDRVHQASC